MAIIPTPTQPKKRQHRNEEAVLQARCVAWLHNEHPETRGLYFCVPNENTRSVYENKKQQLVSGSIRKAMGVVSGVSDTILLMPRGKYHAMLIEFKTETGRVSESQKEWRDKVENEGYCYTIIRHFETFKEKVEYYLNLK